MAKLYLRDFHCFAASEGSSDSPYFLVFHGHPPYAGKTRVERVIKKKWDNAIDTGQTVEANSHVADHVDSNTFVMVALMEEDDGNDFATPQLENISAHMSERFLKLPHPSSNFPESMFTNALLGEFLLAIGKYRTNDDIIGLHRLIINGDAPGYLPQPLIFVGSGGIYAAQFKLA
jgi:hypothetical protein